MHTYTIKITQSLHIFPYISHKNLVDVLGTLNVIIRISYKNLPQKQCINPALPTPKPHNLPPKCMSHYCKPLQKFPYGNLVMCSVYKLLQYLSFLTQEGKNRLPVYQLVFKLNSQTFQTSFYYTFLGCQPTYMHQENRQKNKEESSIMFTFYLIRVALPHLGRYYLFHTANILFIPSNAKFHKRRT